MSLILSPHSLRICSFARKLGRNDTSTLPNQLWLCDANGHAFHQQLMCAVITRPMGRSEALVRFFVDGKHLSIDAGVQT